MVKDIFLRRVYNHDCRTHSARAKGCVERGRVTIISIQRDDSFQLLHKWMWNGHRWHYKGTLVQHTNALKWALWSHLSKQQHTTAAKYANTGSKSKHAKYIRDMAAENPPRLPPREPSDRSLQRRFSCTSLASLKSSLTLTTAQERKEDQWCWCS